MNKFNTLGYCEINNKKQIVNFNDAFAKLIDKIDLKKNQNISIIEKFDMTKYVESVCSSGNELTFVDKNCILKFTKSKNDIICVIFSAESMGSMLSEIKHVVLNKLNYLIGKNRDNVVLDIANEIKKLTVESICKNL